MTIKDIIPKPDITKSKRILCVQPHPDDTDIAAGATIAFLAEKGVEIFYLTVTDDTAGFTDAGKSEERRKDQRKQEQMAAGKILGVKDYYWIDFPDAGNWVMYDARNEIIKHIRMIRPDFVMTVDPWLTYESHQDHIKTGMAVSEALLLFNFPHIKTDDKIDKEFKPYEMSGVAYYFTGNPNTVLDVAKYKEVKFKAIEEHKSQFNPQSFQMLKMYDDMHNQNHAKDQDFKYGEGFKILHPSFMLHSFPEAYDY